MTYKAGYDDTRRWRQSGQAVFGSFVDVGSANAQSINVTFSPRFAIPPNVQTFRHNDPTNVVSWASNVTETGCTITVYRTSGTTAVTVRWVADVPTQ